VGYLPPVRRKRHVIEASDALFEKSAEPLNSSEWLGQQYIAAVLIEQGQIKGQPGGINHKAVAGVEMAEGNNRDLITGGRLAEDTQARKSRRQGATTVGQFFSLDDCGKPGQGSQDQTIPWRVNSQFIEPAGHLALFQQSTGFGATQVNVAPHTIYFRLLCSPSETQVAGKAALHFMAQNFRNQVGNVVRVIFHRNPPLLVKLAKQMRSI